jgi:phage tail protein X
MSRQMTTRQGDVVDQIALEFYGRTAGAAEAVLDANPHLAALPATLPAGVTVILPELAATPVAARVRLWD